MTKKRFLTLITGIVLIAAFSFVFTACSNEIDDDYDGDSGSTYDIDDISGFESTNPAAIQGVWYGDAASEAVDVAFVITGNQVTVFKADYSDTSGNIAFRNSFSGDVDALLRGENVNDQIITFYWFEGDNNEVGSITFNLTFGDFDDDQMVITASNLNYTYQNVLIPPVGTYARY